MKTWNSYGSEHSANIVMIGYFKDVGSAEKAKEAIDALTEFMRSREGDITKPGRYPDNLMGLLESINFYSLHPGELQQFTLDICSELKDDKVIITTDEPDVSAFLKLMIDKGARVEAFSAHDYPSRGNRESTNKE